MSRIICFGEVLMRLAAPDRQLLLQEPVLEPTFCGAEANVAVALAGFGHQACFVTSLPDNPIGDAARVQIESFGVDVAAMKKPNSRLGLYYLEPGAMMRPSRVTYDRAHSAFADTQAADYDWNALLEGVDWLFASGITAALGDGALSALRGAFSAAEERGIRIAFDTNYRAALWRGREQEAVEVLRGLSSRSDVLFAGRRATAMMAGGRYDDEDPNEGFHHAAKKMFELAPRLTFMAATRREVASSDSQRLTGLLADREGCSVSDTATLERIVDRVGTGDAFAAGILHGLGTDMGRQGTVDFATASAQWAHSIPGDFLRAKTSDIEALSSGGKDVVR